MHPSPLFALEENSRDLVAPIRARLTAFCAQPASHARFLNMLSLMEHIGSRKSVLAEEELHLDSMLARLHEMDRDASRRVEEFISLEDERFRALWRAIESDAGAERLAAE